MVKNILWDFDGVILDSMDIRDSGFEKIFSKFDDSKTKLLLEYHRLNGGLSRYVKIRYFYEKILHQKIEDQQVLEYAQRFSDIMRKDLVNPKNLISDTVDFIRINHHNYNFHIVSGSDQNELRYLCNSLGISNYFKTIHGSPTAKNILVKELISDHGYSKKETCLVGDSINDYEASAVNNITFYGYNNLTLASKDNYIDKLTNFQF